MKQYVYYCVEVDNLVVFSLRDCRILVTGYKGRKLELISATLICLGEL